MTPEQFHAHQAMMHAAHNIPEGSIFSVWSFPTPADRASAKTKLCFGNNRVTGVSEYLVDKLVVAYRPSIWVNEFSRDQNARIFTELDAICSIFHGRPEPEIEVDVELPFFGRLLDVDTELTLDGKLVDFNRVLVGAPHTYHGEDVTACVFPSYQTHESESPFFTLVWRGTYELGAVCYEHIEDAVRGLSVLIVAVSNEEQFDAVQVLGLTETNEGD